MKPQDIAFFVVFILLLYKNNPRLAAGVGILCLLIAMPLFAKWVFFTAERLTWYAAAFFMQSIIFHLLHSEKTK
jgi:hypothetical protein